MTAQSLPSTTSDERVMAALAHYDVPVLRHVCRHGWGIVCRRQRCQFNREHYSNSFLTGRSPFFPVFMRHAALSLAFLIPRLIAAVSVASGRDFRYPWIGARVEAFLNEQT